MGEWESYPYGSCDWCGKPFEMRTSYAKNGRPSSRVTRYIIGKDEICGDCWIAPRQAPSVTQFRIGVVS